MIEEGSPDFAMTHWGRDVTQLERFATPLEHLGQPGH